MVDYEITNSEAKQGSDGKNKGKDQSVQENQGALMNWFGKRSMAGCGLFYKFTQIENRLVRWILEKHGFKESL